MAFSVSILSVAVSCAAVVLAAVFKFILHPALFSPLAKIPAAHPLARLTSAWIFWIRYKKRERTSIHEAHQRLGPVVRLGPNEISVNCVKGGIQTVYSGGFEKGTPEGNWHESMFTMARNKPHAARRCMLSKIYSKSSLQTSQSLTAITAELVNNRLLPALEQLAMTTDPANIVDVFGGVTMDFVTAYLFGLAASSNFIQNTKERDHFLHMYNSRNDFGYWPHEWPGLFAAARKVGMNLTPDHVYASTVEIEQGGLIMCDAAAISLAKAGTATEKNPEDSVNFPSVYAQLKSAMDKDAVKQEIEADVERQQRQRLDIASEMMDHLAAGFDTSAITLTFLSHELSLPHNKSVVTKLRDELRGLAKEEGTNLPSAKALDAAPYLHAVLYEALRLHAAIPGPQPRGTPYVAGGSTIGPNGEYPGIPGGVRISAQAWSLHRNGDVFPNPESWLPERWLNDKGEVAPTSDMLRWFWAFISGGRMCVGSNMAIYQMKFIIYAIWANYSTEIVDDAGFKQKDSYTAPPVTHRLDLRLAKLS